MAHFIMAIIDYKLDSMVQIRVVTEPSYSRAT